jgi:hypothetical protein
VGSACVEKSAARRTKFDCQSLQKLRFIASEVLRHIGPRTFRYAEVPRGAAATDSSSHERESLSSSSTARAAEREARPSPCCPHRTSVRGTQRRSKRRSPRHSSSQDPEPGHLQQRSSRDGRHLGCSGSRLLSRGAVGGGPASVVGASRPPGASSRIHSTSSRAHRDARELLQLFGARPARHEVSESIRVGAKPPPRAIAVRGRLSSAREHAARNKAPDPARLDSTASYCPAHTGRRENQPRTGEGARRIATHIDPGFEGPTTVLADRIDGRSRRTARGHERAWVKSPRKRRGLANSPPGEAAKERRKPGTRGKAVVWWRARVRGRPRKRSTERAFVEGRRLEPAPSRSL